MRPFSILKLIFVSLLFIVSQSFSQQISLQNPYTNDFSIDQNSYENLQASLQVNSFNILNLTTSKGVFTEMAIPGFGFSTIEGYPKVPVFKKVIEIPYGADCEVKIVSSQSKEYDLASLGIQHPIVPAQAPVSKADDPTKLPFAYDAQVYSNDQWLFTKPVITENLGQMRAVNLARLEVYPVQYNPGLGKIRVLESITFKLTYRHANVSKTLELKTKLASPYFNSTYNEVCNYIPEPSDALITSCPATYVIVSDIMFQAALQPFIAWKTKKGFKVIEAYTNNPAVGSTTTSIKNYLMGLYNTPAPGINPTSFVLLVGDVAQIPAFNGTAGSHVSDLYYAEYTGNLIPEVFIGRFSAANTTQLQPQIDKTLEYEQYLFPTEAYLGEATMVAGADAGYVTYSNGQINYGTTNYFNAAHGILSHTYLQPEPSGANYSANIISNVSNGVGYANYTAHCSPDGWADPSFVISNIAGLQNASKYPLMVGNCCQSNSYNVNCFGEELLRAANKGAIGYIGASNNSYWDEDYWWGVGFKAVSLNPSYDANHLGAYDITFHDHGEPATSWFVTQGQMLVGGNMAVEESSSSRKAYYWEMYNLMGDPSLMVYFGIPQAVTANYANTLLVGMTSLTVNTEQNALVALSMNGAQLATAMAGATGVVNLTFPAISNVGTAYLVITKQNRKPHIGSLTVVPASGPYVVYTASTINDPLPNGNNNGLMDYAEANKLNVSLKNVGVQQATAVNATLSTTSPYITLNDNTELFGNIDPNATVTKADAYTYMVANNIPDQTLVNFAIAATSGTNTWNSSFSITAQAPALTIGAMTVQDNGAGCNNNGILDPGETANILIANTNTGHSSISNLLGTLSIQGASTFLTINTATSSVTTLAAGASANATFNVTASASTPIGTPVSLLYTLSGGASSQYTANSPFQLVIGLIPTYNMSNTSQTTCIGNFYDSGGASGTYADNENFTMTFTPGTAGAKIKASFLSFATESGYDYLYIYDGPNTSSTQVSGSPFHGSTSPGTITASVGNAAGALTFKFTSDGSVTGAGWSATIACEELGLAVTTTSASAITLTSATSGGNVVSGGSSPVTARGVCWGTAANPTITGNHTVDGSGTGPFTSLITGLSANTTYNIRAYATNAQQTTYGENLTFNTGCGAINSFPWNEGFENAGAIPACWTQEQINSSGLNWTFITGNGTGYPATAHGGTYDACLKDNNSADNKTRLIAPVFNLQNLPSPQLKFWHTQALWSPDQDVLTVYYKTSANGTWTQLASYTTSVTAWTERTIQLPNPSAEYYICFEGNAKYGRGVCVDDVSVSSACTSINPVNLSITSSSANVCAGTSVNFTAIPGNGGTAPSYQWSVNGNNVGNNSSSFTYAPANNDVVSCVLTSNASCISGNPATSNSITLTVNALMPVSVSASVSANNVCAGNNVLFTATPTNGGSTPAYQWKVNGNNVGTNSPSFNYFPTNNDIISCVMTSNSSCVSGNPATSSPIAMTVNPLLPVSVSVEASANPVSSGTLVTFTAYPVNGGSSPSYQWKVNGTNVGSSLPTYGFVPENGDEITCQITSNEVCTSGNPAIAPVVTMAVNSSSTVLTVTALVEGLFNGAELNKAQGVTGDQFTEDTADEIAVELHSASAPYALIGSPIVGNLNTIGQVIVTVPGSFNGNYYLVVKHRNSIETWSNVPIPIGSGPVSFDFTNSKTQAYGENLKLVSGKFVIFSGDINQDGEINNLDMIGVKNEAEIFGTGYKPEDLNGDGAVDALDLIMADNNSTYGITVERP